MKKAVIYIHGKGGNADEAAHYIPFFISCDVIGFDYTSTTPWEAEKEFSDYFDIICSKYESVEIIANSIGAYFTMASLSDKSIKTAYFISPVVDMEKLISNMMMWANVNEDELYKNGEIETAFGETLSWKYLCYVRENPIRWDIPTHILYGENDDLTSFETISLFAQNTGNDITVMKNGEHWFHTDEQMRFLDDWIMRSIIE